MARAAIILAILAVVLSAQCFGACLANAAQPSSSCPHHQKKTVERCEHNQLISGKLTPSQENPLIAVTLSVPVDSVSSTAQANTAPPALSPSPPVPFTITILKI